MQEQRQLFEVWGEDRYDTMLSTREGIETYRRNGGLSPKAQCLHAIEAATYEEAMAIYCLRMGRKPYEPSGSAELCPRGCGSYYYPGGSRECPYCGRIDENG